MARDKLETGLWDHNVEDISHMEYGNRAIQQSDNSNFQGIPLARLEEEDEADPNIKNHLSVNNATPDVPLDTDLKKKQTVRELIAYSETTRAAILSKSEEKKDEKMVGGTKAKSTGSFIARLFTSTCW